ncbi:MAG TPA: winged helix-turn-helix transcriptional regulator [Thermoplasmata archaeon]|nr:winged helix-turn-helix transcriptional regulator [Thermoplasmata archaeon]
MIRGRAVGPTTAMVKSSRCRIRIGGPRIDRAAWILFVSLGVVGLALLVSSPPAAADGTSGIEGGDGQFQVYVAVRSSFDLAESGHWIPMEVLVTEVHGLPQANVPVLLSASTGTVSPDRVVTDARGRASFAFRADVPEDTLVGITAQTGLDGAAQGIDAFSVRVVRLPSPPIYAQAGIVSLGVLGGLAAVLAWTEPGRHAVFGALFPLYTRLKKEEVLDHFVRGQVFGVIKAEPGTNFTEIRDDLGLSNGTLAYHLRTLEVAGFIRSERDGVYKRFFAADAQPDREGQGVRLSRLQRVLIEFLRRNPELPQRDLARQAGVTQQTVSYNLRILQKLGVLQTASRGRRKVYLAADV